MTLRPLAPWLGLAGISLAVVALTHGFTRELWNVASTADLATLREAASGRNVQSFDVPHYIDYGRQLATEGNLLSWHSAFWPPGVALVGATKTKILGEGGYAIELIVFAALLWATAFFFWYRLVPWGKRRWVPFVALSLPWCLPTFREWAIGVGSLGSESVAGALFAIALALAVSGVVTREKRTLYRAVAVLAAAAYFRAEYDLYGMFALCAVMIVNLFLAWRRKAITEGLRRSATLFAIFLSLTLPWKVFLQTHYGHFNMSLALYYSAERVFWTTESPTFAFGGNTPCLVDPETCRSIMQNPDALTMGEKLTLAQRTFFRNPFRWLGYKAQFLDRFWFGFPAGELFGARFGYLADGLVHLACVALGMWILWIARLSPNPRKTEDVRLFLVMAGAFLVAYSGIFILAPLEVRYTFPLRVFCLAFPLAVLTLTRARPAPDLGPVVQV